MRDVVDATSGALVASLDYSSYGQVQRQSGSVMPLYQFAQLLGDANLGLNLSLTRLYDPQVGRWISRDPIGEAGGINLYGYVGGNPTLGVDPGGLQFDNESPFDRLGQFIGAGIVGAGAYIVNSAGEIIQNTFSPPARPVAP